MAAEVRGLAVPPPPRRRSELGLLLMATLVIAFASVLPSLALTDALPRHELTLLVGLVLIGGVVQVANRRFVPNADPVLLPVALVLNGLGYIMIERLDPPSAGKQLAWTVVGLVLYVVTLFVVKRSRDLDRYRFIMLFLAMALLVSPLIPHFGKSENGARLWVGLGSSGALQFQPVEIAKLLLVVFFASYFIEKRELFTIPTRRVGNHLLPDLRAFGPIAVAVGLSLLVILAEHDIGFSLLLFVVFLSLLWVTTGRWSYLVIGLGLFALGTFIASHLLSQVNARFAVWLDPWKYFNTVGYYAGAQPVQGEIAFGNGGLFGSGLGLSLVGLKDAYGDFLNLPVATSDFIYAAFGEETGLFGTTAIAVGFLLMIGSGLHAAIRARSEFAKLLAVGLTALLGFQSFFIFAGVTRLLPLTGVTLPFVSYGGSSLVANYILLALLMRISDEGNRPQLIPTSNAASSSTAAAAVNGTGGR